MHPYLFHYLVDWRPLGYLIIFLGMVFEGDGFLFATAFLTAQGFFDLGDSLAVVLFGVAAGDVLWYWFGVWLQDSWIGRWAARVAKPFDRHLIERTKRTLFISKFTYGFHHAMLLRAGTLRIPFWRLFKIDLAAILLWVAVIGGLGYGFSGSYELLKHYVHFAELGLLVIVSIVIIGGQLLSKYSEEKL